MNGRKDNRMTVLLWIIINWRKQFKGFLISILSKYLTPPTSPFQYKPTRTISLHISYCQVQSKPHSTGLTQPSWTGTGAELGNKKKLMTDDTDDRWRSRYGCLKKRLDLTSQAGSMKLIANVFLNHKNWKYLGENYSFINIGNPLYFRVNFDVACWTPKIAQIWMKSFGGNRIMG